MSMEPAKLLWSVKEVSRALGLSPFTIRRYIAHRKLTTVRFGRRVLVEPSECYRLIDGGRVPATACGARGSRKARA